MSDDKDKDVQGDSDSDADDTSGDSTDKSKSRSGGETEQEKQDRLAQAEQDRLDRTAGNARKEGRTAGHNAVLADLGFENAEEAQAYLKEKREADEATLSEIEKLSSKFEALEKRATDAEALADTATANALTARFRSAVDTEVMSNKKLNVNPEAMDDVWLFLANDHVSEKGIHLGENGKVLGVKDSLEKLIKAKPYLVSTQTDANPGSHTRRRVDKVKVNDDGEPIIDPTKSKFIKDLDNPRL